MCYTIPVAGAIVTSIIRHKKKDVKIWRLNLMFLGGAIFGVVDHLWNRELFLVSENLFADLLLGVVISAIIIVFWRLTLLFGRANQNIARETLMQNSAF